MHRLRKGKSLAPVGDEKIDEALKAFMDAVTAHDQQELVIRQLLEEESLRSSEALRAFARDPLFREAITWQNRNF